MAKAMRPKALMGKGSTLVRAGAAAPKKSPLSKVFLNPPGKKKSHSKHDLPEQAFAIPGFGETGLTGRS